MSLKTSDKTPSKLTVRLFGLTDEFMLTIPDGKKSLFLNQLITDSIVSDRILQSLIVVFGQKEGQKIHKKVKRLTKGVEIDSDRNLFEGGKTSKENASQIKDNNTHYSESNKEENEGEISIEESSDEFFGIRNDSKKAKNESKYSKDDNSSKEVLFNFED